jgi:nucleoside-diphosphate-sugar epimerase
MKKVIITGANGQDGIILSKLLIKKKYLVYKFIKKKIKSNKKNYFITLNKKFYNIKKEIDKIQPNIIIHLGSDNPSYNKKFLHKDYKKNLFFTKKIINYVTNKNHIKLILVSSSKIFKKNTKKVTEDSPIYANDYYSKFRIESANYLLSKKIKHKLNATVLILFNHDSKFRNPRFLLPRLIKAVKKNNINFLKKIYYENICGDFSHAEDICNGIYLLIKKDKNPDKLILSSGKKTYINNIIKIFYKKIKYIKFNKDIKNKNNLIGNNKLAKKTIGWKIKKNIIIAANEIYKHY